MGKKNMQGDAMDGFDTDGDSKNTFAPSVKTTPNKVGADESISKKNGKGKIIGGIEDESIFGTISYTGNTVDAAKQDYKSVDKKVFTQIKYTYDTEGFADNKDGGVFGSGEYVAGAKNAKVNGDIENTETKYLAKVTNTKKKNLNPEAKFDGKNPTSLNVNSKRNIFSKK